MNDLENGDPAVGHFYHECKLIKAASFQQYQHQQHIISIQPT
jgi:DNA polymerase II small subunit/DNA polymerase delta subunit B